MIIECPACTTRYEIKATLPPEGRSVRCAKCGTVWRALPDVAEEPQDSQPQEIEAATRQHAFEEESAVSEVERKKRDLAAELRRQWGADATPKAESDDAGTDAVGVASASHVADEPVHADENAPGSRFASFSEEWRREDAGFHDEAAPAAGAETNVGAAASPKDEHIARELSIEEPVAEPFAGGEAGSEQSAPREDGKVSWFGSFRRRRKQKETEASEAGEEAAASPQIAETIPFPRQQQGAEAAAPDAGPDLRTLEEAREAVRGVFSSLGDGRPSLPGHSFASPMTAPVSETGRDIPPAGARALFGGEAESRHDEGALASRASGEQRDAKYDRTLWRAPEDENAEENIGASTDAGRSDSAVDPRWHPSLEQAATPGDPDAALRKAMQSQYSDASEDKELADELESHLRAASGPRQEGRLEDDLQGDLAAIWKRPQVRAPVVPAEDSAPLADDADEAGFDPRLAREIEATQESSGVPRRGVGSLAVAAGWGLFLTLAAGLVVGLLAFRDIVAYSAPGLAPLYSALGMPVTVQPLTFDTVTYKWTITDGKPTLLVSGAIYNTSKRKVKVPDFTITIRDRDPALDREYSAALRSGATKIRSRQREDFDIELVSPSPTLSSIELALKKVR
jgi:predicted Zn finger-like uncharacterized protein